MSARAMPCPDDRVLFALVRGELPASSMDEVDSHLDECEMSLASGTKTRSPARELARGDAVGRFLVLESIGSARHGRRVRGRGRPDPEIMRQAASLPLPLPVGG